MLDFLNVASRATKTSYEVYPSFVVKKSKDLMIRGSAFYAIWNEETRLWSTDEFEAIYLIDREIDIWYNANKDALPPNTRVLHLWDGETGMVDKWHKFCEHQMRDNFHPLDERVTFVDTETRREDYRSRRLPYPLADCDISAWDKIVSTLYTPEERLKIEWAIGSIFSGESGNIQKFLVFYGAPGSGKSTILNIVQVLFDGYYSVFKSKDLTSNTNAFALEAFRNNPLISIEHEAKLDRIEDNTTLNSLVSHEYLTVNEKYKTSYTSKFRTFLFLATNKPVKITDSRSGLLRRLIDVHPSGNKIPVKEYEALMNRISFELGGIAIHCMNVFAENPNVFDDYIPLRMMDASNDLYNFLSENFYALSKADGISLRDIWTMYKQYCQDANVSYAYPKRVFKEELRTYFKEYNEYNPGGRHQKEWFSGFKIDKFPQFSDEPIAQKQEESTNHWITMESLTEQESILDKTWHDCPAQYATEEGIPSKSWKNVTTRLFEIDTSKLHYVLYPESEIVIDLDLKDDQGKKSLERNVKYAQKFPPTYAEASKSGGLHLHYIWSGDRTKLDNLITEGVEIKRRSGLSPLRRKLTVCNNVPIATISSGLPLKGEKRVVNLDTVMTEKKLRAMIVKNLRKEIHADTRSSIDFIAKLLDDAYNSGLHYDVRDMQNDIQNFAARSTNQSKYCLDKTLEMKFCSEVEILDGVPETEDAPFCFFDIEIFPNLFILCYKLENTDPVALLNPKPELVREFIQADMKRVGFNNRRYDNHLIYAYGYRNYSVEDLYELSQRIIGSRISKYFIAEAYNISHTDIYDFASAGNKKSLKKLEIEMGIHHQEFGHPWDKPLDPKLWKEAAEYCKNDVIATEAAFKYLHGDWLARLILSDLAGMLPNNTTNQLSTKIVFGNNKTPQSEFNYRNLAKPVRPDSPMINNMGDREFRIFDNLGRPTYQTWHGEDLPDGYSLLPFFPGYEYSYGKSTYMGTEVGEGGYVYAEPGMYRYISLLDVASMHPSSIMGECLFGPRYTEAFGALINLRVDVKHGNLEAAKHLFDGRIAKWLESDEYADALANALKTAINSAYGQTSASFENPFRDPRNLDNIVAKRGALFMRTLQEEVQKRGFTVAHIKTDSIKIPAATDELIEFVMAFGREYGYTFEYEARYDCMTLVNDAVYIARYDEYGIRNKGGKKAGEWTATGKQFAVPYVFKTLFTHEDLTIEDFADTFAVKSAIYLDVNEKLEDVSEFEKELKKIDRNDPNATSRLEMLRERIAKGHNYQFIGRTGRFLPMVPGVGAGVLYREGTNKWGETIYAALSGTSGYRWMDYEHVIGLGLQDKIDIRHAEGLANDARDAINQYGDFDWFANHDLNDQTNAIYPF